MTETKHIPIFDVDYLRQQNFVCPECSCKDKHFQNWFVFGAHVLSNNTCTCCDVSYIHSVPVAHAAFYPYSFQPISGKSKSHERIDWLVNPLKSALNENRTHLVEMKLLGGKKADAVVLVNALDSCFGHALLKSMNVLCQFPDLAQKDFLLLLPSSLAWLQFPPQVRVLVVEASFAQLKEGIQGLDEKVKSICQEYTSLYFSIVNTHPNPSKEQLEQLLGVKAFQQENFDASPLRVTFIWRNDKFWLDCPLDRFLEKLKNKFPFIPLISSFLLAKQNKLIGMLAKKMTTIFPGSEFIVSGIGIQGKLAPGCIDRRVAQSSPEIEKEWCATFASSHLVIGVHGSHMLLPTALAGGFIELMPNHKFIHQTEDILFEISSTRKAYFFGRFMPSHSSPGIVWKQIEAMVKGFPFWNFNQSLFLKK